MHPPKRSKMRAETRHAPPASPPTIEPYNAPSHHDRGLRLLGAAYSLRRAHSASAAAESSSGRIPTSSASSFGLTGTSQPSTGQTPAAATTAGAARGPRRPRATAAHAAQNECSQRVERQGRPPPNGSEQPEQRSEEDRESAAEVARVDAGAEAGR